MQVPLHTSEGGASSRVCARVNRRALLLTALEAQRELLAADNASLLDANLVLR